MAAKFDIRTVTPENIGTAPLWFKGIATLILFAIVVGGGYWKDTMPQMEKLTKSAAKEKELITSLEDKQQMASNLAALKNQLEDIKQTMGEMLKKLPSKTQVPDLLQDISQQGLGAGLEFEIFKPGAERPSEFYVELPIQIKVSGSYHAFGTFVSGVAGLQRIVTMHDVKIKPSGKDQKLIMESTAKTYRYLDEEEEAAQNAAKQKDKGKGKGKGKGKQPAKK
jgi:type IV pilus assembly protein PilO